jgi:thiamine biosynthesis protein ThiS
MKIVVNGTPHSYKGQVKVSAVLREMGATRARVAVVVNGEVVSRTWRGSRVLKNNDRLEILTYASGG